MDNKENGITETTLEHIKQKKKRRNTRKDKGR